MVEHASHRPADQSTLLAPALPAVVSEFAHKLRWLGVEISIAELTDALRATRSADLSDRQQLRRRLRITMVKRAADLPSFDAAFDLVFPVGSPGNEDHLPADAQAKDDPAARQDLLDRMVAALRGDPAIGLAPLAAEAVAAFGGISDGQPARSQGYYQYRLMRQLDVSALLQRAMRSGDQETGSLGRLAGLERRERLDDLRAEITAQLRSRLTERDGPEPSLQRLRDSVLDVDFIRAGPAELAAMRAIVRPLARRLAEGARRRRRIRPSGKLDARRTMRRALATGGVPLDPAWRRRHRSRPRLLALCDVSGSVAEFAKFTLSLLHALHAELPQLRSFVFVDGLAEVTELVGSSPGVIDTRLLLSRPGVVRGDGHSDYGAVLRQLLGEAADSVSPDTVIIICGDARTNGRPSSPELLRALQARARSIHWLNPEPSADWDTGDSRMGEYARACASVTEVRNLGQLADWAGTLL